MNSSVIYLEFSGCSQVSHQAALPPNNHNGTGASGLVSLIDEPNLRGGGSTLVIKPFAVSDQQSGSLVCTCPIQSQLKATRNSYHPKENCSNL